MSDQPEKFDIRSHDVAGIASEDTYHRVLNELSNVSAAETRATIMDAIAYVSSTR